VPASGDVRVSVSLTDVRRGSDGADFPGGLDFPLPLRITDKDTDEAHVTWATVTDLPYFTNPIRFTVPCGDTADTSIGASCSLQTTVNALLLPNNSPANYASSGKRRIWELDKITLWDGGEDGYIQSRDDNTPLVTQGVFVP
jgi:hypothetical protein